MAKKDGNAKGVSGTDGHAIPAEVASSIAEAMIELDEIAKKRYQLSLEELTSETDHAVAAKCMRHLIGVAIKKDYSHEVQVTTESGELTDYKWVVDDTLLRDMPSSAWQFMVLEMVSDRDESETGKDVAARLRRETLLQQSYFKVIHPWLCQSPETRKQIKSVLKECGLGEFSEMAGPKGLLKVGAAKLYMVLIIAIPTIPAAAIAVTAVALYRDRSQ